MKKSISTWTVIERIAEEVHAGLDNEEYDVVASLLWDLAFRTAMYAVKKKGLKFRKTWPNVKKNSAHFLATTEGGLHRYLGERQGNQQGGKVF
jgi:hypothetical protein